MSVLFRKWGALCVIWVLFFSHFVAAQSSATASLSGRIADSSGGLIPGASVMVRNTGTNATRSLVSDDEGRYHATLLQPGAYEVTVEMAGFKTVKHSGIVLEVGSAVRVDFTLEVSQIAETVDVTAATPLVEVDKTEYTSTVSQISVENLPINGRRWENFVLLTPGVVEDGTFGLVSYRGVSGLYNNNTIDGADNNQAFFSEARGRTRVSYTISQAAVKEFQVGLSSFSAEFGRAAGGTVNAVTKSGTNEFHGDVFYFIRDDRWMAQEPGQPSKPEERRQQFGFSFGAPIVKDRVFFFGNYDQQVRNFPYFVTPSSSSFQAELDNPATCAAASAPPGCAATVSFFKSFVKFVGRKAHNNVALGKFDFILDERNNLTVGYNWHRWRSPNGIRTAPIQFNAESDNGFDGVKTDFLNLAWNSAISASQVNEFRFQFGRDFEFQRPNAPGPGTSVSGGIAFGMPNFLPRPAFPDERRWQFVDNYSVLVGKHSLKFGVDMNYVREEMQNLFNGGGVYSYSNLSAIASDCPKGSTGCTPRPDGTRTGKHYSSFNQAFDLTGRGGKIEFSTTDYNFYIQDTYKVRPSFTLNLGLRYESQRLPQPEQGNPAFPETQKFNQDTNNFGPRFGFAWDIGGTHDTVIRGGYGIYYARTSNSAISNALTNNAKVFASFFFTPTSAGSPVYPNVFTQVPTTAGGRPDVQFLSKDFVRPLVHMAQLSIERQLTQSTAVSATYLFSRGQRLPLFRDLNLPLSNSGVVFTAGGSRFGPYPFFRGSRPNSSVGRITISESVVNSNYHGLVLQITRRFSQGLQFNANFTWSKALDEGQTSQTFFGGNQPFNTYDLRSEYGPSTFDVRRRFVANFVWEPWFLRGFADPKVDRILGNWKLSGIVILSDGRPHTGVISGSLSSATGAVVTSSPNGSGGSSRAPFFQRNSFVAEGRATVDFRVTKEFRITEDSKLVFLWEAFNLFNHTNPTSFSTTQYRVSSSSYSSQTNTATVVLTPDTGFLRPRAFSSTLFGPRDMQFGLKFLW